MSHACRPAASFGTLRDLVVTIVVPGDGGAPSRTLVSSPPLPLFGESLASPFSSIYSATQHRANGHTTLCFGHRADDLVLVYVIIQRMFICLQLLALVFVCHSAYFHIQIGVIISKAPISRYCKVMIRRALVLVE